MGETIPRDPQTPAEWQDAVNCAEACLLFESARLYGLVTGGLSIDVDRCEQILADGRARQVLPRHDGVDAHVAGLIAVGRTDLEPR